MPTTKGDQEGRFEKSDRLQEERSDRSERTVHGVGTEARSGYDKGRRVDVRRLSERGGGKRDVEIISSVGEVGGESSRDGSGLVVIVGVELKREARGKSASFNARCRSSR